MAMRSHIAYYNSTEIERIYSEHIADKVEVSVTEGEKVTTTVYGWLMHIAGRGESETTKEKIREMPNKSLKQAKEVVVEFLDNRNDIPPISERANKESNYYKFSGKATIDATSFNDANENDPIEVYGKDEETNFFSYTSFGNWVDGNSNSMLLHAADAGGVEQKITGLAYPMGEKPEERGYRMKFVVIYI